MNQLTSSTLNELGVLSALPMPAGDPMAAVSFNLGTTHEIITNNHHNNNNHIHDHQASACLAPMPSLPSLAQSSIGDASDVDIDMSIKNEDDDDEHEIESKPTSGRGSGKSRLGLTKAQMHQRRLEKNRMSARRTRARKKMAIQGIHKQLEDLQKKVPSLEAQVAALKDENAALKARLALFTNNHSSHNGAAARGESAPALHSNGNNSKKQASSSARDRASSLIAAVAKRIKKSDHHPGSKASSAAAAVTSPSSPGAGLTLLIVMFGLGLFMTTASGSSYGPSNSYGGPTSEEPWRSGSRVLSSWQDKPHPELSCSGELSWDQVVSSSSPSPLDLTLHLPLSSVAGAEQAMSSDGVSPDGTTLALTCSLDSTSPVLSN